MTTITHGRNAAQGAGVTDIGAAVALVKSGRPLPTIRSSYPASSGLG